MNELLYKRQVKRVLKYGVPRYKAEEIVTVAMEVSNEKNIEWAIDYAIDIIYKLGVTQKNQQSI